MGRQKTYDAREKLTRAMRLFHKSGFAGTSTADLVEDLGINRKSMYAEFGGKQEMFEAALDLYSEIEVAGIFGQMETPTAGVAEIEDLLGKFSENARGPAAGLGCLLCNTAVELAPGNPDISKHVRSYVERISAAFQNTLGNARVSGDVAASVDIETEARFLTSHVLGQLTLIRANVAPEIVESAASVALDRLRTLESRPG